MDITVQQKKGEWNASALRATPDATIHPRPFKAILQISKAPRKIMAQFLRDHRPSNLTIDAETLAQLANVFSKRAAAVNAEIDAQQKPTEIVHRFDVIRFDNRGYKLFSLNDLLGYFSLAQQVERILFTAESGDSVRSNRAIGNYMELRLDADPSSCYLTISSDDKDWMDASFSEVSDVLSRAKNRNYLIRNPWIPPLVQFFGVVLVFILSLWIASRAAPQLNLENGLMISFLFVLLILSNIWSHFHGYIGKILNRAFPNIYFHRPNKAHAHWLLQALVGGAAFALVAYAATQAQYFLGSFVSSIVLKQ